MMFLILGFISPANPLFEQPKIKTVPENSAGLIILVQEKDRGVASRRSKRSAMD